MTTTLENISAYTMTTFTEKEQLQHVKQIITSFHNHFTPGVLIHFSEELSFQMAAYSIDEDCFHYFLLDIVHEATSLNQPLLLLSLTYCVHELAHRNDSSLPMISQKMQELIQEEKASSALKCQYPLEENARDIGILFIRQCIEQENNPFSFDESFIDLYTTINEGILASYRKFIEDLEKLEQTL